MMAIDIKKFQSVKLFKKRLKKISDLLRNTPPAKGFKQVMVPGDPEKLIYKKRVKQGIPLTQEIIEDYHNLAKELNLNINL
jgi:ureidoglycolate dehydrogenase (NAD+)